MVNSDWELGIPNHNNFGSKNLEYLEIPRNSKKFQVHSQQDLEFLGIPWNSNSEHLWLSLKSCKSKKNPKEFLEFSGVSRNV